MPKAMAAYCACPYSRSSSGDYHVQYPLSTPLYINKVGQRLPCGDDDHYWRFNWLRLASHTLANKRPWRWCLYLKIVTITLRTKTLHWDLTLRTENVYETWSWGLRTFDPEDWECVWDLTLRTDLQGHRNKRSSVAGTSTKRYNNKPIILYLQWLL